MDLILNNAEQNKNNEFMVNNIANELLPHGYKLVSTKNVLHDSLNVCINRYQKSLTEELFGEHFSISTEVVTQKLLGIMFLDKTLETVDIPSEEEAQEVALGFMKTYASDIYNSIEVRWIRPLLREPKNPPHDEPFWINSLGNKVAITGVRVKMFDKLSQKFAWVIVGKNKKIVSFERDIMWDYEKKCRLTQKWLHDSWALENLILN